MPSLPPWRMPLFLAQMRRESPLPWAAGVRGLLSVRQDHTRGALCIPDTAHRLSSKNRGEITALLPSTGAHQLPNPVSPPNPHRAGTKGPGIPFSREAGQGRGCLPRGLGTLKLHAMCVWVYKNALFSGQR